MKKIIASTILLFDFTAFLSVNSFAQTQQPVKKEAVSNTKCTGHSADSTKTNGVKTIDSPKKCCNKADGKKCNSSCPHAKEGEGKKSDPATPNDKKTVVPQK